MLAGRTTSTRSASLLAMALGKVVFCHHTLFALHVRDLPKTVNSSGIGCSSSSIFVNIFAYADDMVLLTPCWTALQEFIILIESICREFDLVCKTKKTVCMMFCTTDNSKRVALTFPQFFLGSCLFAMSAICL